MLTTTDADNLPASNGGQHVPDGAQPTPNAGIPLPATPLELVTLRRRLVILGLLLMAAIFGAAGLVAASQRANDLAESQLASESLAQVLAEQTSRTLQSVDLTLRELQSRLEMTAAEGWQSPSPPASKAMFDLLVERLKGLPQLDYLMIVGKDGTLLNFSRSFPTPAFDLSSRDFHEYFRDHDDQALFISAPVKGYLQGKWIVYLSRRINDAHGGFAGVVVAVVKLSFFEDFYRAVTPENGSVMVLRRDGTILVRNPPLEDQIGNKLPADSPWYGLIADGGGSYRSPGYFDHLPRLVTVRPLRDFPLIIDVAQTEVVALAIWHRQALWLLAGAAIAAGCVIFLLWVFGRQYIRLTRQNEQMEIARQRFDMVLGNMSQGITLFGPDNKLMFCNHRYTEIYKVPPDLISTGMSMPDLIKLHAASGSFPDQAISDYIEQRKALAGIEGSSDAIDELRDGRTVSMHSRKMPHGGWLVTHEDITERRRAEETLAFMARHDALTELPNRTLFQERLAAGIAMTGRGGHCALLCLDLDRFKVVNDTLGHPIGDALLRAVAVRLSNIVREGDTVARLGGDEFAIILTNLKTPEDAAVLAERIIMSFDDPHDIGGHRIIAGTSIGVSVAPEDGLSAEILLQDADIALYLAKAEGRGNYRFFKPEIDSLIQRRRAIELELRNALPAEHFVLHYQPILDLATGRVTGLEALIRWHHPDKGMVSPVDFIPIAEETGLIIPIGAWALQQACMDAAAWPNEIDISVNLSPIQFKRGNLLDVVQAAIAVSGLAPTRLKLEITELTLLENSSDRLALLHQLRALGIRIALDDFGTGYSSLSYLRSFPFDKIKIDQSFIRELGTNKESAAIVGAIVGLALSLGMTTVAEGVETMEQLAMVRDQGCAKVQGYLFSRPRPAEEVAGLIRTLRIPEIPADKAVAPVELARLAVAEVGY